MTPNDKSTGSKDSRSDESRFYFYRTWRCNWDDLLEKLFKKIFKKKRR